MNTLRYQALVRVGAHRRTKYAHTHTHAYSHTFTLRHSHKHKYTTQNTQHTYLLIVVVVGSLILLEIGVVRLTKLFRLLSTRHTQSLDEGLGECALPML